MHCLVLTGNFPNRLEPGRASYNGRQVEELARRCEVTVVNPLPWPRMLPGARWHGLAGRRDDVLDGVPVYHPTLWYLPVVGRGLTWRSVLAGARGVLEECALQNPDLILATFAYPHGRAARELSDELGVPYAIKARGTDLHGLPARGSRRRRTAEALRDARAVVAVSSNLARIAGELGAAEEHIHVLPNGVDADRFALLPRDEARSELRLEGFGGPLLLFVGNLLRVKGPDLLLEAILDVDGPFAGSDGMAVFSGDGPLARRMRRRVTRNGLEGSTRMLGRIPHEEVALWMNAADLLVLPSRDEGCPNVVLEALACGTPVVASRVGAVPDLLDEECGLIVPPESPAELSRALGRALERDWDREQIRRKVAAMSWEDNGRRLWSILREVVENHMASPSTVSAHNSQQES